MAKSSEIPAPWENPAAPCKSQPRPAHLGTTSNLSQKEATGEAQQLFQSPNGPVTQEGHSITHLAQAERSSLIPCRRY